jgi:hypothetical protein
LDNLGSGELRDLLDEVDQLSDEDAAALLDEDQ